MFVAQDVLASLEELLDDNTRRGQLAGIGKGMGEYGERCLPAGCGGLLAVRECVCDPLSEVSRCGEVAAIECGASGLEQCVADGGGGLGW